MNRKILAIIVLIAGLVGVHAAPQDDAAPPATRPAAGEAETPTTAPDEVAGPKFTSDGVTLKNVDASEDELRARLYGALVFTTLDAEFEAAPVRDVLATVRAALGVPLVARYATDRVGHGLDPETLITISMVDASALDVIEAVLAQCARSSGPCTWQLRRGFVEVGTKRRLSLPPARELRMYYIADIIMDIPESPHKRRRREEVALDVIGEIVENVEPGAWDYGQEPDDGEEADATYRERPEPEAADPGESEAPRPDMPEDPDWADDPAGTKAGDDRPRREPPPRRYVLPRKTALIRYWRDYMIIDAPDYIHRQIGGFPTPIAPAPARSEP